jgi:hypothetical protein
MEAATVSADDYKRAERELTLKEWRRGWMVHAAIYAVVMSGLVTLNVLLALYTDASFFWFPFPLVGWGIGLGMHYLHGVRRAERELERRQERVERHAQETRRAA